VVVKRWKAAQSQVAVSSDSAFTGITYGEGGTESYGYNAGTLLNNLRGTGEIKNQYQSGRAASSYTCRKTPFIASLLISYKPTRLLWAMSEAPALQPGTDVMEVTPEPTDSQQVGNLWYYRYTLQQPLMFTDTGSQIIPVYSTHPEIENCNHTEVINIPVKVNAGTSSDFTYSNSRQTAWYAGCRLDSVYLKPVTTATSYRWSFSAAVEDTSLLAAPSKLYQTPGIYPVHLQAIQADGCVADTTKNIQIYGPPVSAITFADATVCAQSQVTVNNTSAYAGSTPLQAFYQELGDGRTAAYTTASFTVQYSAPGEYRIRQVAKISDRCISDTAVAVVKVFARPFAAFTFSKGCLGADGTAQFTNTSTIADAQPMTWLWNFGDPASGTANTSASEHPSHAYSSYQEYAITLRAATAEGCVRDTTIKATFALKPVLVFDTPGNLCNTQKFVALNKARVTNGVPGTGTYKGKGMSAEGTFNAAIAGVGTHEIGYVFQTQGDCRDSVFSRVTVVAAPVAGFTVKKDTICAGDMFAFTDASSGGSFTAWKWIWGDGSVAVVPNPRKSFLRAGAHRVGLVVTDAQGCNSDTAFRTVMQYDYLQVEAGPSFVAAEGTRVTFAAYVSDPAARLQWSPAGAGLSNSAVLTPSLIIKEDETFTLTATNAANCSASDFLTIKVVKPVIIPNIFTPNGDGVNDYWVITNVNDYAGASVQVFNRYGTKVWQQTDARPWDGIWQGKQIPAGTYYYIIDLKNGSRPLSGSITLVR
jgi:gliding motility-associated-like protein